MKSKPANIHVWISEDDIPQVQEAILRWGKSKEVASKICGASLHTYLNSWEEFVDTNWENWSIYEYDHDVGVRSWIQLFIENTSSESAQRIESAIQKIDEEFKKRMKPARRKKLANRNVFKEECYFWETHTIHPEND